MEWLVSAVVGALGGSGVNKAAPALDAGPAVNGISGLLGGLAGNALLSEGLLSGITNEFASSAVGGGIGGIVLAAVVGFLKNKFSG